MLFMRNWVSDCIVTVTFLGCHWSGCKWNVLSTGKSLSLSSHMITSCGNIWVQVEEISFLHRVAGLPVYDRYIRQYGRSLESKTKTSKAMALSCKSTGCGHQVRRKTLIQDFKYLSNWVSSSSVSHFTSLDPVWSVCRCSSLFISHWTTLFIVYHLYLLSQAVVLTKRKPAQVQMVGIRFIHRFPGFNLLGLDAW